MLNVQGEYIEEIEINLEGESNVSIAKIHIEQRTIKMAVIVFMCIACYTVAGNPDNTSLMMISSSIAAFGIHPKRLMYGLFEGIVCWVLRSVVFFEQFI